MSKLRPGFGPSRKEKKANRPPGRLEQEEIDLWELYHAHDEVGPEPFSAYERFMAQAAMAQFKRQGEMIRHLQEIEGRAHRGR